MRLHCSVGETNIGEPRGKESFHAIKSIFFSISTHKVIALKTSVLHFYIATLLRYMIAIVKRKENLIAFLIKILKEQQL